MSEAEANHTAIMKAIAEGLHDTPLVLKGGTALLLKYGLNRHSVDLDYDSSKKLNLVSRLDAILKRAGLDEYNINVKKDTGTTTRYIVKYQKETLPGTLKIEIKNKRTIDPSDYHKEPGFNIYTIDKLCQFKLSAGEGRTSARDIYDLTFIANQHGNALSSETVRVLNEFVKDPAALKERFEPAWQTDRLLSAHSFGDTLASLTKRVTELVKQRRDMEGGIKSASSLLESTQGLEREQQSLLEGGKIKEAYQNTLNTYVQAKYEQVEIVESRLKNIISQQQVKLQQLQRNTPGVFSLPKTRHIWQSQKAQQQLRLHTLQNRLSTVSEIKEGMGLHSPRIEELAIRKMRTQNPELTSKMDAANMVARKYEIERRMKEKKAQGLVRGKGKGRSLTQSKSDLK